MVRSIRRWAPQADTTGDRSKLGQLLQDQLPVSRRYRVALIDFLPRLVVSKTGRFLNSAVKLVLADLFPDHP